jgi:hypothetical protein
MTLSTKKQGFFILILCNTSLAYAAMRDWIDFDGLGQPLTDHRLRLACTR